MLTRYHTWLPNALLAFPLHVPKHPQFTNLTCLFTLDLIYPGPQVYTGGGSWHSSSSCQQLPSWAYSTSQTSGLAFIRASNSYRRTEYTHFSNYRWNTDHTVLAPLKSTTQLQPCYPNRPPQVVTPLRTLSTPWTPFSAESVVPLLLSGTLKLIPPPL